jgi:hypothetical protein
VYETIAGAGAQGIYEEGTPLLNTSNFENTAYTSARVAGAGGPSTYSVVLPPGEYQLTTVPLDPSHPIAVKAALDVKPSSLPVTEDVTAPSQLWTARGFAALADGRPLGGATVEAMPTGCYQASGTACTPRGAATTTAADGSYTLGLDLGSYTLRVEPAPGTGFPWSTTSLLMTPTDVNVPTITVPAPVDASLTLHDPADNAVIDAIVRVYELPASGGPAVEIGRAITDTTGFFEMYLAPSGQ